MTPSESFSCAARVDTLAEAADRAARTIRPEARFEIRPRGLLIGEHGEQLVRADGEVVVMHMDAPFVFDAATAARL